MKLFTEIQVPRMPFRLGFDNRLMVLGSCFADNIGRKMSEGGLDVCINPFGVLYNPVSILSAVRRLSSGTAYSEQNCVPMGAGAEKICSFEHHTSFARATAEEFLENANAALAEAAACWKDCDTVIITFGTAMVWDHKDAGIVSNCLKRPANEFSHYMLGVGKCSEIIREIVLSAPSKRFIFTVSPIRHLSLGAHNNTLSKATLHLGIEAAINGVTGQTGHPECCYFPAYEIVTDELRDYRFYAEDLVHPGPQAVEMVWEKFQTAFFSKADMERIAANTRESRRSRHQG